MGNMGKLTWMEKKEVNSAQKPLARFWPDSSILFLFSVICVPFPPCAGGRKQMRADCSAVQFLGEELILARCALHHTLYTATCAPLARERQLTPPTATVCFRVCPSVFPVRFHLRMSVSGLWHVSLSQDVHVGLRTKLHRSLHQMISWSPEVTWHCMFFFFLLLLLSLL